MKKLLGLGLVCGCLLLGSMAQSVTLQEASNAAGVHDTKTVQHYLSDMGVKILNASNIDKHVIFGYDSSPYLDFFGYNFGYSKMKYHFLWGYKDDVTYSNRYLFQNRKVIAGAELFEHATSDDEVAAMVSHEIAHCLKSYTGILRGSLHALVYTFTAKKQNYDADLVAVELMAKAGYNPVALITILDKAFGQYRFDIGENALTTKRIRKINNYIKEKYPQYIASYASNPYYKNALLIIAPMEQEKNWRSFTKKKSN